LDQQFTTSLLLLFAGLLLIALAIFLVWRKAKFFRRSKTAIADVVSFDRRSVLEGNLWRATVEFTDDQGEQHKLDYTGSDPYPPFAKAKNLKVYYDPQSPTKAYAYSFWKVWVAELSISCMGLLLAAVGAGDLYAMM